MQAIKGSLLVIKYWLAFTEAENENSYLTDI